MDVKYSTQAKIADASREYQMNKAAFDQEVNTKKAEAELAYELQVFIGSFLGCTSAWKSHLSVYTKTLAIYSTFLR